MERTDLLFIAILAVLLVIVRNVRKKLPEDQSEVETEKRKEERKEVSEPASFSCYWVEENGPEHIESEGQLVNISKSGLCLYTDMPIHNGIEIKITRKAHGNEELTGTVIWCNKLEKKHYQIGISVNHHGHNQNLNKSTEQS